MNFSVFISCTLIHDLTGWIEPESDELWAPFEDVDPERLAECRYWRCGELFEARSLKFTEDVCRQFEAM